MFKLTKNYDVLNYNSLYRVRLVAVVNKPGFVHPELELGALPETLARKALKFSLKDLLTDKNLAGGPNATCLSVTQNDINCRVKSNQQLPYRLEAAQKKKYGQTWKTLF